MENFVRISLETHLFFARIMKEHSFFLQAGFLAKDTRWIRKADFFRNQFEELLRQTVRLSNRRISRSILQSEELATSFTLEAEAATSRLSNIPIDRQITEAEFALQSGCLQDPDRNTVQRVWQLNERGIHLLGGLIAFKENILREVCDCRLFTANYPLLIEHIMREARLYRATLINLREHHGICFDDLVNQETFWNQIMMEHALFIRGLLDPSEDELVQTANTFAMEFQELLCAARTQDERAGALSSCSDLTQHSLEETRRLREFKAAGTKGILDCQIRSIILPLLADHVLREANHYIRILENPG